MLKTKRFYRHDRPINDFDSSKKLLKLHGHIYGTKNDIGKCYNSLLSQNMIYAEYHFITEFLEEK
jgi:hypothetical protein